jgi:hypothetical protein
MRNTLAPGRPGGEGTAYLSLLSVVGAMLLDRQQGCLGVELLRIVSVKPARQLHLNPLGVKWWVHHQP